MNPDVSTTMRSKRVRATVTSRPVASAQRRDGVRHAAQAFADQLGARRVRQPDVAVGAEVGAGNDRDTRVLEEEAGDVAGARERCASRGAATEEPGDIGERVERAL